MSTATILVVEDDPLQMDMLEMILARNDMTLLRACTGEIALELYQQHAEIDLILLDVMLPGQLDGHCRVPPGARRTQPASMCPSSWSQRWAKPSNWCRGWTPAPTITSPSRSVREN